ncbi:MAG: elongation factor 1-beta [Candidatus Bathyarchaeota archaeon]|nr:elongation factor 1-beta [Candidatus Bathyarchaeota archaeon]
MPKMRIYGAIKMANVVISYKIFPTGIEVDFNKLQKQIEKALPPQAKIYADYQTEPVAFGLNALIAYIRIPEDETGILDEVEKNIEKIPTVSQIQTLMVRRTR